MDLLSLKPVFLEKKEITKKTWCIKNVYGKGLRWSKRKTIIRFYWNYLCLRYTCTISWFTLNIHLCWKLQMFIKSMYLQFISIHIWMCRLADPWTPQIHWPLNNRESTVLYRKHRLAPCTHEFGPFQEVNAVCNLYQ